MHGLAKWMPSAYVVVPYRLLYLILKISSAKLFNLSGIWRPSGAIMYLLEPKGGGGGRSGRCLGLFYCLIFSGGMLFLSCFSHICTWRYFVLASIPYWTWNFPQHKDSRSNIFTLMNGFLKYLFWNCFLTLIKFFFVLRICYIYNLLYLYFQEWNSVRKDLILVLYKETCTVATKLKNYSVC